MITLPYILREEPAAGGGGGGAPPPVAPPPVAPPPVAPPPVAPPPKPFYEGLYGADGKLDKGAFDRLPDHLKPFKDQFGRYETVDALLQGAGNAFNLASKKALAPLDENAPDSIKAERKALLDTANNVPKDVNGYGIAKPQDLPDMFWHQEAADSFGKLAQKHSLSPSAVKELFDLNLQVTRGELEKAKAYEAEYWGKQDQGFEAGVKQLGMDMEKATDLAKRGAATLGIDVKGNIFKDASVRLGMIRMAQLVSESKLVTGDPTGPQGGTELQQARDVIGNPQNPMHKAWNDPNDPRHDEAIQKVNALYAADGAKKKA